jgi:hypothetical protein
MVTGIILIILGVAAVVGCRAYVGEPVLRNVGIVLGIVVGLLGLYFFLTDLAHGADVEGVEVDSAPPVVLIA